MFLARRNALETLELVYIQNSRYYYLVTRKYLFGNDNDILANVHLYFLPGENIKDLPIRHHRFLLVATRHAAMIPIENFVAIGADANVTLLMHPLIAIFLQTRLSKI